MKIKYGASIPPGLAAPTHGEVRVRLEKLVLHSDTVPSSTPIHDCDVEAQWWGEEGPPSVGGTPSTMEKSRGSVTLVFPVKTLQAQMEQYFSHMSMAKSGLRLAVVVPTSFTGKKTSIFVGSSLLKLEGLTPKLPISGWFNVVNPEETRCIGRMHVSVWVQYFAGTVNAPPAPRTAAEHEFSGPPKIPPHAAERHLPEDAAAAQHGAEKTTAAASVQPHPAGDVPAAATAQHAQQEQQQKTLPTAVLQASAPVQKPLIDQRLMREIFNRGMELRDRMAEASHTTSLNVPPTSSSVPFPLHQHTSKTATAVGVGNAASSASVPHFPQPSGCEHLHENIADTVESESDIATVSSDTDEDEARGFIASQPDGGGNVPVHHFHGAHQLALTIDHVSFSRVVTEVRFCIRTSKDVTSPIPMGLITTPVYFVPLGSPVKLEMLIASFSSISKLVVECFDVRSRFDASRGANVFVSEKLLGIVVLGLFNQSNRSIFFHDPIAGEDPVQATVSLSLSALSTERENEQVLHAQQQIAARDSPQCTAAPIPVTSDVHAETTTGEQHHKQREKNERTHEHSRRSHRHSRRHHHRRHDGEGEREIKTNAAAPTEALVVVHPKPTAPPLPQQKVIFRLEVNVACGKNFPMLSLGDSSGAGGEVMPPCAFLCLEDFISVDGTAIPSWTSDTDRSTILPPSTNPKFEFSTIANFRSSSPSTAIPLDVARVAKVVFSVWTKLDGADYTTTPTTTDAVARETHFWTTSRQLGRCEVALNSMRFLPNRAIEGWYHVSAGAVATSEALRRPIGQLKVRVALIEE